MIVKLRLEAEGTTLDEVLKDIEAAAKAAKLPKDLQVHDEHYERVHATLFKGRRVFGRGPVAQVFQNPLAQTSVARGSFYGTINATAGTTVTANSQARSVKPAA